MKNLKKFRTETIEEFMTRGGVIQKIEPKNMDSREHVHQPTNSGPAVILSLEEADLFYGEAKVKKAKSKSKTKIDLSALPEALRKKFVTRVLEEAGLNDGFKEDEE